MHFCYVATIITPYRRKFCDKNTKTTLEMQQKTKKIDAKFALFSSESQRRTTPTGIHPPATQRHFRKGRCE